MKTDSVFEIVEAVEPAPHKDAEEEYAKYVGDVLDSLWAILGHLKKCVLSHDKHVLELAQKTCEAGLKTSLPLAEKVIRKKERTALDKQFHVALVHFNAGMLPAS